MLGWVRLTHPFPSVLDGLVSCAVALLAGAPPELAVRIGAAMTLLQLGIGTINDLVDAPRDAGRKAGKPIPAGLVPPSGAVVLAATVIGAGVALAASVSIAVALLAVLVIAIGLAYDLRLKGTAWSWLPFAIGIPILPVFGWVGATGTLDPIFVVLLPTAVVAGAALAIGNALVDVERDRGAGVSSIAVALGPERASSIQVAALVFVGILACTSATQRGVAFGLVVLVFAVAAVPLAAAAWASTASSARRERLWQIEAIGLAVLTATWLTVIVGLGRG